MCFECFARMTHANGFKRVLLRKSLGYTNSEFVFTRYGVYDQVKLLKQKSPRWCVKSMASGDASKPQACKKGEKENGETKT